MRWIKIDTALSVEPVEAVVVVDVIRAMTTAVTAVALGRRCLPVPSLDAARATARRIPRSLLGGELGGQRPAGFDLDNSPAEINRRGDLERPLVLLSSSGTRLLHEVRNRGAVYAACLRNAAATAAQLLFDRHRHVAILGAASRGQFREEDQLCCVRIAALLARAGFRPRDAKTATLIERWRAAPTDALLVSPSARWLVASGQGDDLEFVRRHVDDLALATRLRGDDLVGIGGK
ncbi:MAG TPA: 2-phosphosulfolactate phosphatase [Polyangia bacterium]